MRVACANISLSAQRDFQRAQQVSAARRVPRAVGADQSNTSSSEISRRPAPATDSDIATGKRIVPPHPRNSLPNRANSDVEQWLERGVDASVLAIKRILEHFLGHEIAVGVAVGARGDDSEQGKQVASAAASQQQTAAVEEWVHLSLRETERTEVAIAAEIRLQSGASIQVAIDQRMARSLIIEKDMTAQAAAAYLDPLAINFGGPVALSDKRVDFDLNGDGVDERIAVFSSASGFIALDKNGDGVINDGSELFGAVTGDGFAELAAYDDDGNGFIDDGDAVFSRLSVFRPGEGPTVSLASRDVAALYLGNVASPFQLNSPDGEIAGRVRATGFYLGGSERHGFHAGTLQQIDLVI